MLLNFMAQPVLYCPKHLSRLNKIDYFKLLTKKPRRITTDQL